MKKIIIAMMAAVSLLNFSGCDSLDMEPVSSISDANYWKSPDQFKAFNIGLHGLLRSQSSYNIFVLGEPLRRSAVRRRGYPRRRAFLIQYDQRRVYRNQQLR
mgnify:CR=1 FL=1